MVKNVLVAAVGDFWLSEEVGGVMVEGVFEPKV